jgi:hypothetical protein
MNGELKKEGVTEMRVKVLEERTSKTQQVREKGLDGSKWLMYSENMHTSTNALASMSTKLSEAANAFETAWHPAASRTAPDPIRSQSPPKPAVACVRVPRGDTVTRGVAAAGASIGSRGNCATGERLLGQLATGAWDKDTITTAMALLRLPICST